MRWARALVLTLAVGSAAGAAIIVRNAIRMPAPRTTEAPPPRTELLVMIHAVGAGEMVEDKDVRWQPWPAAALPADAVQHQTGAAAPHFQPGRARYPLIAGEPVAEAKLLRPGDGGVMAALIAPGMRAVAVPVREESAVGGLIQPNDRVDVLWTRRVPEGSADTGSTTRTILRGAKVLAIGRTTDAASRNADGRTATLELTPEQAGAVAGARTSGEISLSLIPSTDIAAVAQAESGAASDDAPGPIVKMLKFGRQPSAQTGRGIR